MIKKFFRNSGQVKKLKEAFDQLTKDFIEIGFSKSEQMKWRFQEKEKSRAIDSALTDNAAKEFWFQQPWLD